MLNIVIADPTDLTGHPQKPAEVHLIQEKNLLGFLRDHRGALMLVMDTTVEVPHPYQGKIKLIDAPAIMKRLVDFVYFSLARYRDNIHARARIVNVKAGIAEADERAPRSHKRPENYVKWLEEHQDEPAKAFAPYA